MLKYTLILGLKFFHGSLEEAITEAKKGGLVTFPSGPGLSEIDFHPHYQKALQGSDLLLADSGLLALVWKFISGQCVCRISGYRFLKAFLKDPDYQKDNSLTSNNCNSLWVMPSDYQMHQNIHWLRTQGIQLDVSSCYVAPSYKGQKLEDARLLSLIQSKNPRFIFICIGGGIQEKLGLYLKENLHTPSLPTILCTGAAIAFLSGMQAYIPLWADNCYLGWLFRILQSPHIFLSRYWKARRLIGLLLRYKTTTPKNISN